MHTFAIITNSPESKKCQRDKILSRFQIGKFSVVTIGQNNQSIEAIRNAQKIIQLAPSFGKKQALIIENIDKFVVSAQQALLKTIEEPPQNTIIIIEADNQDQILPTILSRSQLIYISDMPKLTLKEEKEITAFWAKLFRSDSLTNRLQTASSITSLLKERAEAVEWLDAQMVFFHQLLHKRLMQKSEGKNLTPKDIVTLLKLMLYSKKYLLFNVNLKLLVDHLFLNLPTLNP